MRDITKKITVTLEQYSVKDKLPNDRELCLWYDARTNMWRDGVYYADTCNPPGLFSGIIVGYICDGRATHWMPMPDAPGQKITGVGESGIVIP